MRKNNKGITLIALVVTIIVLLILAGVSIITLTGDNGIINRTQQAKQLSEEAAAREKVKLAVQAARVHDKSYSYLKASEVRDAVNNEEGLSTAQTGDFPVVVTAGKFKFTISSTGEVGDIEGIIIPETEKVVIGGSGKTLTPELGDGITGTVEWSSSDSTKVRVENGTITAVAASSNPITITASIKDLATGIVYKDTCAVTVASKITQITVSKNSIEISNGGTATISTATTANVVISNIQPEGNVESLVYSSSDTSIAEVSDDGTITAKAVGTATISIKGETQLSTDTALATISVEVTPGRVSVTAAQIAANPETYYGQEVKNYTAGGATYRIFYVDTAGDFGPANTIYLKADYDANRTTELSDYTSYTPKTTNVLEKMNPDWWENRSTATWNANEHCAAYLCDPTSTNSSSTSNQAWANYFDSSKASYVIGSPSVEMYVASYNQVSHTLGNYTLGALYRATNYPGYIYTIGGTQSTISNNDYYTGNDTLDYSTTYR